MSQILIPLSVWLHALAKSGPEAAAGALLSEISGRSRAWLYASLVAFLVTGVYLTVADPNYLGFADFGNPWGILMLVKHILVLGMIAAGFWFNAILRVGPQMSSNSGAAQAIRRFRSLANLMAVLGVLVLLLTALAQGQ